MNIVHVEAEENLPDALKPSLDSRSTAAEPISVNEVITMLQFLKDQALKYGIEDPKVAIAIPGEFTTTNVSFGSMPVKIDGHPNSNFIVLIARKEAISDLPVQSAK